VVFLVRYFLHKPGDLDDAFKSIIHDKLDNRHKLDAFRTLTKKDLQFKCNHAAEMQDNDEEFIIPTNSPTVAPVPKKKRVV